jgi:hypothetical protein
MCSCLIWISCSLSRSSTLQRPPVTKSRLEPCNPAQAQPMCITSQPLSCDSDPAHRPTVARLTGIKRRVRTFRRLQLVCFQMDLRGDWSSTCPIPPPYPRRNQVGPRKKTHYRADCSSTVNLLVRRSGRWVRFQALPTSRFGQMFVDQPGKHLVELLALDHREGAGAQPCRPLNGVEA